MTDTSFERLDKWLWFARFFRTRTMATEAVQRGKVRVNAAVVKKPAKSVTVGDTLTIVQGRAVRVVRIKGFPERRGPASQAQDSYVDLDTE